MITTDRVNLEKKYSMKEKKGQKVYDTTTLTKATEDVESEMEKDKRKTEEFLAKITTAWVGDETKEEILESIHKGRTQRLIDTQF